MLRFASVSLFLAACSIARPAAAEGCLEAISDANTRKLFEALGPAKPVDGCTLENVGTDKSQMKIQWKKAERLQEAILVVPTSCVQTPTTRAKMSAIVPPSVAAACPEATRATLSLLEGGTLGDLVPVTEPIPLPDLEPRLTRLTRQLRRLISGRAAAPLAAGIALAAAAVVVVLRRRRSKRAAAPEAPVKDPAAVPGPELAAEESGAPTPAERAPGGAVEP